MDGKQLFVLLVFLLDRPQLPVFGYPDQDRGSQLQDSHPKSLTNNIRSQEPGGHDDWPWASLSSFANENDLHKRPLGNGNYQEKQPVAEYQNEAENNFDPSLLYNIHPINIEDENGAEADKRGPANPVLLGKRKFMFGKRKFMFGKRKFLLGKRKFLLGKRPYEGDYSQAESLYPQDANRVDNMGLEEPMNAQKRKFLFGKRLNGDSAVSSEGEDGEKRKTFFFGKRMEEVPDKRKFLLGKRPNGNFMHDWNNGDENAAQRQTN